MSLPLLKVGYWPIEVPLSMSLLCFKMGTKLGNFHICGIMLLLEKF